MNSELWNAKTSMRKKNTAGPMYREYSFYVFTHARRFS